MDTLTQKIKELQQKGLSIRAISRELGLSHVAILKRLRKDKASGNQDKNPYHSTDTHTGNLPGNFTDQAGNQLCKSSPGNKPLQQYQKDLCNNWESCPVCQLELERFIQLKELYMLGAPASVLCSYFGITAKGLADHAFQKNWHKQRAGIENPERKRIIRQMIEDETWKVVMESKTVALNPSAIPPLTAIS